eukprot:gene25394-biopygen7488
MAREEVVAARRRPCGAKFPAYFTAPLPCMESTAGGSVCGLGGPSRNSLKFVHARDPFSAAAPRPQGCTKRGVPLLLIPLGLLDLILDPFFCYLAVACRRSRLRGARQVEQDGQLSACDARHRQRPPSPGRGRARVRDGRHHSLHAATGDLGSGACVPCEPAVGRCVRRGVRCGAAAPFSAASQRASPRRLPLRWPAPRAVRRVRQSAPAARAPRCCTRRWRGPIGVGVESTACRPDGRVHQGVTAGAAIMVSFKPLHPPPLNRRAGAPLTHRVFSVSARPGRPGRNSSGRGPDAAARKKTI